MSHIPAPSSFGTARGAVAQARHKASPFVEKLARFGYAAKGFVYCLVGALAVMAAVGSGSDGQTGGSRDALRALVDMPLGKVLLALTAVGLAGYALWQFVRSIEDPENEGSDGKAIAKRVFYFVSGVIHAALVISCIHLLTGGGNSGGGGGDGTQSLTARVMEYPAGKWLVAAAGLGILGFGLQQIYSAFKAKLDDMLDLSRLSPDSRRTVVNVSRAGIAARGVVFAIIGSFVAIAGLRADPQEARGVGGALQWLQSQSYGWLLLAAVALGLIAYGVYMFLKARYRHIEVE